LRKDFYAYQFKPVLKLLNSATSGILIADEVGLGETIDFRRLLVLCPAVLREKWRLELSRRFGVTGEIVDAATCLSRLRHAGENGPLSRFALVGSLQGSGLAGTGPVSRQGPRPRRTSWRVSSTTGRTTSR
jgi:hypothetical protein